MIAATLLSEISSALSAFLVGSGIVLLGFSLNFIFACTSGWKGLAKDYQMTVRPRDGVRFRTTDNPPFFGMNSGQGVDAILTPRGVYLAAQLMRRPFHPPLLLPWQYFERMAVESDLFTQVITLEFADTAERRIRFRYPKRRLR